MLSYVVLCCVRLYLLAACVCVGLGVASCRAPSLYVALRRLFLGASLLRVVCSTVPLCCVCVCVQVGVLRADLKLCFVSVSTGLWTC